MRLETTFSLSVSSFGMLNDTVSRLFGPGVNTTFSLTELPGRRGEGRGGEGRGGEVREGEGRGGEGRRGEGRGGEGRGGEGRGGEGRGGEERGGEGKGGEGWGREGRGGEGRGGEGRGGEGRGGEGGKEEKRCLLQILLTVTAALRRLKLILALTKLGGRRAAKVPTGIDLLRAWLYSFTIFLRVPYPLERCGLYTVCFVRTVVFQKSPPFLSRYKTSLLGSIKLVIHYSPQNMYVFYYPLLTANTAGDCEHQIGADLRRLPHDHRDLAVRLVERH